MKPSEETDIPVHKVVRRGSVLSAVELAHTVLSFVVFRFMAFSRDMIIDGVK
jgi:hypothetical protein